nr:hypothetical protein [Streptomyces sp. NBC_01264]
MAGTRSHGGGGGAEGARGAKGDGGRGGHGSRGGGPGADLASVLRFATELCAWVAAPWALAGWSVTAAVASVVLLIGLPTVFSTPGDKAQVIVAVPGGVTVALVLLQLVVAVAASWSAWPAWAAASVTALAVACLIAERPRWRGLLAAARASGAARRERENAKGAGHHWSVSGAPPLLSGWDSGGVGRRCRRVGGVRRGHGGRPGADPSYPALGVQVLEVPVDGHPADAQVPYEITDPYAALGPYLARDQLAPLPARHSPSGGALRRGHDYFASAFRISASSSSDSRPGVGRFHLVIAKRKMK